MKRYNSIGLVFFVLVNTLQASAQHEKPVIDSAAFEQWSALVGGGDITADGRYASYLQRDGNKQMIVFKSTTGNWWRKLPVNRSAFLANNKQAIWQSNDTLYFIELGTDKRDFISGVQSFELLSSRNNEWLLYKLKSDKENTDLYILNTRTRKKVAIGRVNDYYFFENSASLLLIEEKKQGGKVISNSLRWYDLIHHQSAPAFNTKGSMPQLVTCKVADQFCYLQPDTLGHSNALLFYKRGMTEPVTMVSNQSIQKPDTGFILCSTPLEFTKDGKHIVFKVKAKSNLAPVKHAAKVSVWRYNDELLPTEQRMGKQGVLTRKEFRWSVSVKDKKMTPLENREVSLLTEPADCINDLLCKKQKSDGSTFWQKGAINSFSVIGLNDSRQIIIDSSIGLPNYYLSLAEKYIVYYDPIQKNYFCFDLASAQTRNLTVNLNQHWSVKTNQQSLSYAVEKAIAGWLTNDEAVLICADYDIWKLDLAGIKPPVNITNGLGERHHIRFRMAAETGQSSEKLVLNDKQDVLLYAFDSATKKSGFYRKRLNDNTDPVLLNMDAVAYTQHGGNDLKLQKAKQANKWIITRESAAASPNLFMTTDFRNFTPLSDIHPEKEYNWLTSELITWQLPDGQYSQGLLYKPDNFNSSKKYPVIFEYYEERSDELNQFIEPRWSRDRINIPYFVSRGYLVFVPDIHYTIANVGESALNSVVSAAQHLSRFSWIDGTKMGLQGHSFGGEETNYIVTHSSFFAAACEAAGSSDAISAYGSLLGYGPGVYSFDRNFMYEVSQGRMRASLAEIPGAYIKASPVLNTAGVTTPLLMMHNKNDSNVPWNQAVEFFTGLKRMGKRVWMLEYEGAGHSLFDSQNIQAKDYTIRMLQFFDHYLKGAPTPKWMLEDGGLSYELDRTAPEPEPKEVLYKGTYQKVLPPNAKQTQQ